MATQELTSSGTKDVMTVHISDLESAFNGFCDLKVMAQAAQALFEREDGGEMSDINRLLRMIVERADDYAGTAGAALVGMKGGAA
jgi:hypothetical protein